MVSDNWQLQAYLKERIQLIDSALDRYLPGAEMLPAVLHQAMRYSVFAGGKRIRPILMLAACDAVGGTLKNVLPAACAIEMLHTYSLIHDDLPAMDDDDYRRGNPTNHKVYGEATAILAGDGLLTEAFILLSNREVQGDIPADSYREAIHI
ncbi:MAG: polyprenyl synthetase family protein, partial [Thermodesulfobacteriota bacterium]|nr:polyprenyl synthetase family protein [Thermodesulfobacteriota bacterium]